MPKFVLNLLLLGFISVLASCSSRGGGDDSSATPTASEAANCLEIRSYGDALTLSGNASYQYRPTATTVTNQGTIYALSGNPVTAAIPFAEIEVFKWQWRSDSMRQH